MAETHETRWSDVLVAGGRCRIPSICRLIGIGCSALSGYSCRSCEVGAVDSYVQDESRDGYTSHSTAVHMTVQCTCYSHHSYISHSARARRIKALHAPNGVAPCYR